jgi:hypothetical protein
MPVDDVRLSQQQFSLLRWIAKQVGILADFDDPEAEASQFLEDKDRARIIEQAKGKAIRWSSNKYFGPSHIAYQGVSDAQRASLSRSLKSLEQRGFIKRLSDGRIKLTAAGHRYLVAYYLGNTTALQPPDYTPM